MTETSPTPAPEPTTPVVLTQVKGKISMTQYELIKLIILGAAVLFFIIGGTLALIDLNHITQPFTFVDGYLPLFKAAIQNQYGMWP